MQTVTLTDNLYKFYEQTIISPINLLDIFPVLATKLATTQTLLKLQTALKCVDVYASHKYIRLNTIPITIVDPILLSQIDKEEHLSNCLLLLIDTLTLNTKSSKVIVYDLVKIACSITFNFDLNTVMTRYSDILVNKLLKHSKVDPLLISINFCKEEFIKEYSDDIRANKISCYKLDPNKIILDTIIIRIFLLSEVCSKLNLDIYAYILLLEVL